MKRRSDFWRARGDLNPGSPAPQASVLIQTSRVKPRTAVLHSRLRARINGRFAKEISLLPPKTEETIINTLIALRGEGLTEVVLQTVSEKLRQIARHTDLMNPDAVKQYIALLKNERTGEPLKNCSKNKFVYVYDKFCKVHQIEWKRPRYKVKENVPLIPTTHNLSAVIDNADPRYTVIFKILAETGAEGHELATVTRNDIDAEQGIIRIKGCKGHASGTYKLKQQTAEMLRAYLCKHPQKHPFPNSKRMSDVWRNTRRRTAKKLCNPEIDNILLKSLRNYSGAQLYHKTKDPIRVMRHLRHKKLETTMHYIRGMTLDDEEEYTCRTASDVKEATELIEAGFQYVTDMDGLKLFRKRK